MSSVLDGVDRLTKLAGHNRLELLVFRLNGKQKYGINVFKVQEVIHCPKITRLPESHAAVCGVTNMRGITIPIYDLSYAIGNGSVENKEESFVVITEFNRRTQGFLVSGVEHIVNMNWDEIITPPDGMGEDNYLTAVTESDDELIQILDVEKVIKEISGSPVGISAGVIDGNFKSEGQHVLIADDSQVARHQVERVLNQLGIDYTVACDGQEAHNILKGWAETHGDDLSKWLACIISDVEMPHMDGYMLTTEIRQDPQLKDLFVVLHTSMSGVINQSLVDKVGANLFLPKYSPDELALTLVKQLTSHAQAVQEAA